jgi:eukaryotic-like serine/threonine-protein kinase
MTGLLELQGALTERYEVERELGRGGMAAVYLALDRKHQRRVAIKVLHPEISQAVGSDRFLREIAIAARLQHPHILGLHESGEAAGLLYYVMPFVEGESLRDRLIRERQIPIDAALRIALEVANALGHAHTLGVVHRDVKPDNILLSGGHAIVADFGIATALSVAGGEQLTRAGTTLGTPQYMSPEQAAGEPVDGRSDLYALGCVLYEMLAGSPPFTGPTSQAILARHAVDPVPSLRTVRRTVPPGVEWVIDRVLAKVPADRFATAAEFADALTHPERAPIRRTGRRPLLMAVAAVPALAGLMLGLNVGGVRAWLSGGATGFHSLAVLPVANLTGDTGQVYLADAMTDQFITDLAQIAALRVIGRTSVQRYRGTTKTAREIARELGVDAVLSASLQRVGDVIRVTAQLSSAPTGEARWASSFDGDQRDVLRLESDVSRAVAGEVTVELTPQERRRFAGRRRVVDPGAYGAYVKGRYFWNKRTGPDLQKAIGLFTQALDLDPTYAAAYSGLADAYIQMGYASLGAPADLFPKAREAAVRAVALDSTMAEPHAALGFYHLYYSWDWAAADREFRRALTLNPNYATVHEWYGLYLAAMGRLDDARAEERRAEELDPLSAPIAGTRGWVFHYSGQEDSAGVQLHKALALDSANPIVHFYLGRVYQALAQYDSAAALYESTGRLRSWAPTVAAMGTVYGLTGRRADAQKVLRELEARSRHEYITAYGVALVYTAMGDRDHAFIWLRQAVAERSHWLVWLLRDARWQPLQGDPRFQEIVRQVGLPG